MKKILLALLLTATLPCHARNAVAVVADRATYDACATSVERYAAAIRQHDGKNVLVLVADWTPERLRDTLKYLHAKRKLEGAVLVGNIPVPMIRRAHHLATAFKMDAKMPVKRSSIPSDRFYDDFGLRFSFINSDGPLYYYDLMPEGNQRVRCDIYTARIKPSRTDPEHSFEELICEFLDRAAAAKGGNEKLDRVFHFGGHGNSSESINARIDEERAYYEQFGLKEPAGQVRFLNFDEERFVRDRLKAALASPDIDFAHLHTHGAVGTQYISKEPYTYMATEHMELAKKFLRSKMRDAKDKTAAADKLQKTYGVPENWLAGWDDPEVTRKDSLFSASVDITLKDLDGFQSGAKVILLDACFNGAFLHDDYVAARYAFGHGSRTMAVTANTVNIIQDHWKNELAGMLAAGSCVGEWSRRYMTLESHLFGDPTYRFLASAPRNPDATLGVKINDGKYSPSVCLDLLRTKPSVNVRLEAFYYIIRESADLRTLNDAILLGLDDPYEMIRRMAANYAEKNGDPQLLDAIARHYLDPQESSRVRMHLLNALALYPAGDVEKALRAAWGGIWPTATDFDAVVARICNGIRSSDDDIAALSDSGADAKEKMFTIRRQRNACIPSAVEPMLALLADDGADIKLRAAAAEALGWYTHSWRRQEVYNQLKKLQVAAPEAADEIQRSIRRLEDIAHTR